MSQLVVNGCQPWSAITQQWALALQDVVIRHPNGSSNVVLTLTDGPAPNLMIHLDETCDSRDPRVKFGRFVISNVKLTYFPGVKLAREWLAAAFAGYVLHEALELVTVGNLVDRPLCPHTETSPGVYAYDKGLRDGLPLELNPATLIRTLAVVMPTDAAVALAGGGE